MFNVNRDGMDRHLDNARLKVVTDRTAAISGLIGSSPNFLVVVEQLGTVASVDCAVLIQGETGTGKEDFARANT
jgi:transcriptional regulator of aroF, aroG, tyrA and aromatic amino acid transport